ncbi:MAG: hypothetical protein KIS79_04035 [Burkholderiales bacterium]|nr:hypothetical protein [Burkholderiales bacterium]
MAASVNDVALSDKEFRALGKQLTEGAMLPPTGKPHVTPADFGYEADFHYVARFGRTDYFLATTLPTATSQTLPPYQTIVAIHDIADNEQIDFLLVDRQVVTYSKTMDVIYNYVLDRIVASPHYTQAYGTVINHYTTNTRLPDLTFPPGGWRLPGERHRRVEPISAVWYVLSKDERGRPRWLPRNVVLAQNQGKRGSALYGWSRPNDDYFPVNSFREAVAYRQYLVWMWSDHNLISNNWTGRANELHKLLEAKREQMHPSGRRYQPYEAPMELQRWPLQEQAALCLELITDAAVEDAPILAEHRKNWRQRADGLPKVTDLQESEREAVLRLARRFYSEESGFQIGATRIQCIHSERLEWLFDAYYSLKR